MTSSQCGNTLANVTRVSVSLLHERTPETDILLLFYHSLGYFKVVGFLTLLTALGRKKTIRNVVY